MALVALNTHEHIGGGNLERAPLKKEKGSLSHSADRYPALASREFHHKACRSDLMPAMKIVGPMGSVSDIYGINSESNI